MNIINYLFISKVRIEILKLYFMHKDVKYHIREVTRITAQELNAVRRELIRLSEIALLIVEKKGNRVYYSLNNEFVFYKEIESIMYKCYGLGGAIIDAKDALGVVDHAFLLESYINRTKVDAHELDLVLVGNLDLGRIENIIQKIQKEEGREINYTVLQKNDFDLRVKRKDSMTWDWIVGRKIEMIGSLEKLVKSFG